MLVAAVFLSLVAFSNAGPNDDPETLMTPTQMIQYWGYPAEEHSATTPDGYILGMHRIPSGIKGVNPSCRPVVFMQHGLEAESSNWIANMPDQSAGFMFADAGFDVWLGNIRGNTWSLKHVNLTSDDEKFWEFSWDEMAKYDLPTMIDYVLKTTGRSSLYYIGHSQGTLTMFAALSENPSLGPKVKKYFALAPVAAVKNIQGTLRKLADNLLDDFELYYELFGSKDFLPHTAIMELFAEFVCGPDHQKGEDMCDNLIFQICGPEPSDQFNTTRTEVYLSNLPAGTSTQNVIHWAQMVQTGGVPFFDYGSSKKNKDKYGQSTPPLYDFSTIKTDMYLYWSDLDYLADQKDIEEYLIPALNPTYLKLNQFVPGFTHIDFIWGMRAASDVYTPILNLIKNELGGTIKC